MTSSASISSSCLLARLSAALTFLSKLLFGLQSDSLKDLLHPEAGHAFSPLDPLNVCVIAFLENE